MLVRENGVLVRGVGAGQGDGSWSGGMGADQGVGCWPGEWVLIGGWVLEWTENSSEGELCASPSLAYLAHLPEVMRPIPWKNQDLSQG